MDTVALDRAARTAGIIDTLTSTRTLAELDRRDWLVFRRVTRLCAYVPIKDIAEGEPDLYGHWLDA